MVKEYDEQQERLDNIRAAMLLDQTKDGHPRPAEIVQSVAELPGRSSPDDWPEAMLVTALELMGLVTGR